MARFIQISALTLIGAGWLAMAGCSGSNDPAQTPSTGGTTSTSTGGSATTATGGTGASTGGATGTSTGGAATTTTGGATTGGDMFTPLCSDPGLVTAAGVAPTKGGVCTTADAQLCYKTCGPQSVGFKSETCTSGAYVEQSGCSFKADLDASCYKIPTTIDPSCPTTAPKSGDLCTVAPCTPCADASLTYLDSSGAPKTGYCVCPPPNATTGMSKWSCASTTAWPCPQGKGC
jgi:hypothetical protein